MAVQPVAPGLYMVSLGFVNAFLLEGDGLTLIDTGVPNSGAKILAAVHELGKQPSDLRHILITHCHPDHAGGLAEIKAATGANTYAHALDAPDIQAGKVSRPIKPTPGILSLLKFVLFVRGASPNYPPATIDQTIQDGEILPFANGLQAIHAPGHSAGQLVFFWPHAGGVLIAADACDNSLGLSYSIVYEDLALGKQTLNRLAKLDFDRACFGHGKAIVQGAAAKFRRKWG